MVTNQAAADRASNIQGAGPGEVVNAFLHEDAAWRMEVKGVAALVALEAADGHSALLKKG